MSWLQIVGLVLLTLIVLVCLWPRGRRSSQVHSREEDGGEGGGHRSGFQGAGGAFGGAGATAHWSDHGGSDAGGHDGH